MKIPLAKPWFTEKEAKAAYKVVKSGWLISGKTVEEFERQFAKKTGTRFAIAVNSGSSALLVAQAAAGVSFGDEVIAPDMTFISTASSCLYLGARPVFTDIELSTYCMEPDDIEKRITSRTKVIIPVHYAGQTAEMARILEIAKRHNLVVIEDACEAHLAEYNGKKAGSLGVMGVFSFTPSKPMTTGEGGMITTNDKELAKKCHLLRNFGDTGKFDWSGFGFNFRMPEVMGAIGKIQLKKVEGAIKIRREIAARYTTAFGKIDCLIPPFVKNLKTHIFQLYTLRLKLDSLTISRDDFIKKLGQKGIDSRLYYPCLHRQGVFKDIGQYQDLDFPNAVEFSKSALSLPIYPGMSNKEIKYIIDSVKEIALSNRR